MGIGQRNCEVDIKQRADGQDAAGQPVDVWVPVFPGTWADIRYPSGLEAIAADRVTSAVKSSIRIDYNLGVTAAMRVYHETDVYEIRAVLHDRAGRKYTDLICELVDG